MTRSAVFGFAVFAAVLAILPVKAQENRTISLSGSAEILAKPDRASFVVGVTTQSETARGAADENSAKIGAIITALTQAGVDQDQLVTRQLTISPVYNNSNNRTLPPEIAGYRVSNSVAATLNDIALLGILLDEAIEAGANTVSSVQFHASNADRLLDEARQAAFANAKRKAEAYAAAGNFKLLRLLTLDENARSRMPQGDIRVMQSAARESSIPIAAGSLLYTVDVQITWEIE